MVSIPLQPPDGRPFIAQAQCKGPPLYVLLIGIDRYALPENNLHGAVADVNAVQTYLEQDLLVHPTQIRKLCDEEATRDRIIQALQDIQKDERIEKDDPILIYYAGHGGQKMAPEGWTPGEPDSFIQFLIPHDYGVSGEDNIDAIPDRSVQFYINDIAQAKGNNITVIFDSCHSSSGTRGDEDEPSVLVRSIDMKIPLPINYMDTFPGIRKSFIDPASEQKALESHVLLAACGANEEAKEQGGKGRFTSALLETLRRFGVERLTYYELMKRVNIPGGREGTGQNPQCEGVHQDRIVFKGIVPSQGRRMYQVEQVQGVNSKCFRMRAGVAQGITIGSYFNVYSDLSSVGADWCIPLGSLVAKRVGIFMTSLDVARHSPDFDLRNWAWALKTRAGEEEDLHIHIADPRLGFVFEQISSQMQFMTEDRMQLRLVGVESAHISVALDKDGKVIFNILNDLCVQHGLTRVPFSLDPTVESIYPVISSAARFFWHLHRSSDPPDDLFHGKIDVQMLRLRTHFHNKPGNQPYIPIDEHNLIKSGIADFVVDDDSIHGFKITNNTDMKLFCAVFYFDNSDFSIASYYQTPTGPKQVDPPLRPGGYLTIGWGESGTVPYQYFLRPGQDVDVGFVKIFITTHAADFRDIEQSSPFQQSGDLGTTPRIAIPIASEERDMDLYSRRAPTEPGDQEKGLATQDHTSWQTILVTIVQRRSLAKTAGSRY